MYRQFNIQQFYVLPTQFMYVFFCISEQTAMFQTGIMSNSCCCSAHDGAATWCSTADGWRTGRCEPDESRAVHCGRHGVWSRPAGTVRP